MFNFSFLFLFKNLNRKIIKSLIVINIYTFLIFFLLNYNYLNNLQLNITEMNIKAKILEIYDTVTYKESFRKREFVVEYAENPSYPQTLKFEMINDNAAMLDSFKKGDEVDIDFDLRGREWINPKGEKVYFNSLTAFRLKKLNGNKDIDSDIPPPPEDMAGDGEPDKDLPF